jgi:hypothetical protein
MAKASKHKFKEIRKKLKVDVATSIENVLKKLSTSSHTSARKLAKGAAAKVARDFVKKLKKEDKAERPSAKRKPAKKVSTVRKSPAAAALKKTVAAKKPIVRKTVSKRRPAVKKQPVKIDETPAPAFETSSENL